MANYALMGNDISNAAGNGPPNFPFGLTQPGVASSPIKDLANGPTYTITNSDGFSYFTSSVALTVASKGFILPLAANNIGRRLTFKRTDNAGNALGFGTSGGGGIGGFNLTIAAQGSDVIDQAGMTSTFLCRPGSFMTLIAESPGFWRIIDCFDTCEFYIASVINFPVATGTYFDVGSCILPAGTWNMTGIFFYTANGAATNGIFLAIYPQASPSLLDGYSAYRTHGFNGVNNFSVPGPTVVASITVTTTYVARGSADFTGGPPKYTGRFTCVRCV